MDVTRNMWLMATALEATVKTSSVLTPGTVEYDKCMHRWAPNTEKKSVSSNDIYS